MAQDQSGNPIGYVTVEIYDQPYHLSGHDIEHIRALAVQNGMTLLREDGMARVLAGDTTLEEILRVTRAA